MEESNYSVVQSVYRPTSRIQQLIIQNLFTLLFSTAFCAQTLFAHAKHYPKQTENTFYSLAPVPNALIFLNFTDFTPSLSTEHAISSVVTVAERRQYITWYAESHTDRGIRYRSGSQSIENGFDCSGFVNYVMQYFDIKTKRSSSDMYNDGIPVPVESAKAGDLVFFGSKSNISHVAMVVSNDAKGLVIVHSCSRGIVKENITESSYWKSKLKPRAVNVIGL